MQSHTRPSSAKERLLSNRSWNSDAAASPNRMTVMQQKLRRWDVKVSQLGAASYSADFVLIAIYTLTDVAVQTVRKATKEENCYSTIRGSKQEKDSILPL